MIVLELPTRAKDYLYYLDNIASDLYFNSCGGNAIRKF